MAWLESKAGLFRIRFRFAGGKHILSLKTDDQRTAQAALGKFEANLQLIEQGVITAPPPEADLGTYVISAGKLDGRPSREGRTKPTTLGELLDGYLAHYPKAAKEASTWRTERIHLHRRVEPLGGTAGDDDGPGPGLEPELSEGEDQATVPDAGADRAGGCARGGAAGALGVLVFDAPGTGRGARPGPSPRPVAARLPSFAGTSTCVGTAGESARLEVVSKPVKWR
jgi:hypothetical protein